MVPKKIKIHNLTSNEVGMVTEICAEWWAEFIESEMQFIWARYICSQLQDYGDKIIWESNLNLKDAHKKLSWLSNQNFGRIKKSSHTFPSLLSAIKCLT